MHQHGGDCYTHKHKIDFSANINPLGIPKSVLQAAILGVQSSDCYPDTKCRQLREAISNVEKVPEDYIICGNGAADLIFSLVLSQKPKKALLPIPSFYEYEQALRGAECEIIYYSMKEETGFLLHEDIFSMITQDLDMIFLCNPNNPTGCIIEPDILMEIIIRCEKMDVLLVLDECFLEFVKQEMSLSMVPSVFQTKHVFVIKAFTKLYAIPGLRLGYGICSDVVLLEKMKTFSQPWSVSIPAQMAGIAALKEVEYVEKSKKAIEVEKEYIINALKKWKMKVYSSQANFIFFYTDVPDFYKRCLELGVVIRDCSNYKGLENGYYRIGVKKREENEILLNVFGEVV